jgi:hypothetical protein
MLDRLRDLDRLLDRSDPESDEEGTGRHTALRMLAAQLLIATAADATRDQLQQDRRDREAQPDLPSDRPYALIWGPSLLGSLAAAAQIAHAVRPSDSTTAATRLLNASVIGIGLLELGFEALATRRARQLPSLAPLGLATAGLVAALLDRYEREEREAHRRLARRASVVERLVPRRRPKLDRIVVHV